jgi:hypothetical protein
MQFTAFIGPSYEAPSLPHDAQRTVNLYPEVNPLGTGKGHEIAMLIGTPGLKRFATSETGASRAGGAWASANGRAFFIIGATLYEASEAGELTFRGALTTASGRVSIAESPYELLIVDGAHGYLFEYDTDAFSRITDVDFPNGATAVVFVDATFIVNAPDSQRFYISGVNDGAAWDTLDFSSKEGAPDNIIALAVNYRDVYLIGSRSMEIWIDTGALDFPFERRDFIEYGLAAAGTLATLGGTLIGVSNDKSGQGIIGQLIGLQAARLSTHAIEHKLPSYGDVSEATSWAYQHAGHYFYCVNFPNAPKTWVRDMSTGLWHERVYLHNGQEERHRAENHCFAFGKHLVGDYANGNVYELDDATYDDDGAALVSIRRSPHVFEENKELSISALNVEMETGPGPVLLREDDDGQKREAEPQAMLRISRDGGRTWGNELVAGFGKLGQYLRHVAFRRLGYARDWVFEVRISDPVKRVLLGASFEVEVAR